MAVTAPETADIEPTKGKRKPPTRCGFCSNGNCEHCPRLVKWYGKRWYCKCDREGCKSQVPRCTECKNENPDEVSPSEWRCYDPDACQAAVQKRLDSNPLVQQIRVIKERIMAETAEKKTAQAEKKEKAPTFCLVTGEPTKGGLFKPGMDARYVSLRVAEVMEEKVAEKAVRERLDKDGISDSLKAKFDKSLRLARERAEKKAEAAAAKAKGGEVDKAEAAKPAPAKKAAAAKKA